MTAHRQFDSNLDEIFHTWSWKDEESSIVLLLYPTFRLFHLIFSTTMLLSWGVRKILNLFKFSFLEEHNEQQGVTTAYYHRILYVNARIDWFCTFVMYIYVYSGLIQGLFSATIITVSAYSNPKFYVHFPNSLYFCLPLSSFDYFHSKLLIIGSNLLCNNNLWCLVSNNYS